MAPQKRAASTTSGNAGKRAKGGDATSKNIELVKEALLNESDHKTPHFPMRVREMLAAGCNDSLRTRTENRLAFPEKISYMIKEVLDAMKADLERTLQETTDASAEATTEKAKRAAEKEKLQQELAAKKEELTGKTDAEVTAGDAARAAEGAQKAAEKACAEAEKAKTTEVSNQETAKGIVTNYFLVLKDNPPATPKECKKLLAVLEPHLVKVGVDESLVRSAPTALMKKLEDRGDFDNMVVNHINTFFQKLDENGPALIQAKDADIEAKEAEKTQRTAENEAAKAALTMAQEAAETASQERKELEKKVKEAQKAITQYGKDSSGIFNAVSKAKEELDGFAEVMDAIDWLNGDRKEKKEEEAAAEQEAGEEPEMAEE